MSNWTAEQDRRLLMCITAQNVPKKSDWVSIATNFGNGKSAEACRQHFGKLLKEFPGTIPAIDGEARGTKRKADQEGDEGASADAGSDEPVTPEKPKKAAAKAKATPKAKKDTDGAKGKTASARGGKAAGTGRGGKKAKKEAVIAEKETVDAKKGAVDATKEVIDEEGTEDAPGEIVEKGTFIAKEDEAKQDDGGEQHEEL